jgi:hypothetical protein
MRNLQAGVLQERYKTLEPEVECWPFRRESGPREREIRRGESGVGVALAPIALEAPIRDQRHAIALAAILATAPRLRAAVTVVNVVAGAAVGGAPGNRKGRRKPHEETLPAQRLATGATRAVAPGFDGDAVIALPASVWRARRCQYVRESGDSESDCYCYCSYQHGANRKECGQAAPRPF